VRKALHVGLEDFQLTRTTDMGVIERIGHGVYRTAGAAPDELQALQVAWLRLDPAQSPADRVRSPSVWVSHESAVAVYRCGAFQNDVLSFIVRFRHQPSSSVRCR
jgi:hypothetical protein